VTSAVTDAAIVHVAHYKQSMTYFKLLKPSEAGYRTEELFETYLDLQPNYAYAIQQHCESVVAPNNNEENNNNNNNN
jgi:hypothetical protein